MFIVLFKMKAYVSNFCFIEHVCVVGQEIRAAHLLLYEHQVEQGLEGQFCVAKVDSFVDVLVEILVETVGIVEAVGFAAVIA